MTDIAKKLKNATQDVEAKIKTEEEHAEGKPSSETLKGESKRRFNISILKLNILYFYSH